jgi:hypothetical protein
MCDPMTILSVVGSAFSAIGQIQQGKQQQKAANAQATPTSSRRRSQEGRQGALGNQGGLCSSMSSLARHAGNQKTITEN